MSYIPSDAVLAIVAQPKRMAASEIGKVVLGMESLQAELARSAIKPADIERVIYTEGTPGGDVAKEFLIVQFVRDVPRGDLLESKFWAFPFEEVQFNGLKYYLRTAGRQNWRRWS